MKSVGCLRRKAKIPTAAREEKRQWQTMRVERLSEITLQYARSARVRVAGYLTRRAISRAAARAVRKEKTGQSMANRRQRRYMKRAIIGQGSRVARKDGL